MEFANNHAMLRAWAIEGTGGHGAGLSRHLLQMSQIVIELDRPKRAARRNGAKSDPLDAIRAAREAMARPRLGTPRSGGERQALSVLLAARRSAINASTEAQLQVFSLVIAAPEPIRARFRGQKLAAMLNTAANLRVHASWDTETTSTVVALRTLARRAHAMLKEARELQKAMVAIIRSWRPDLLEEFGVGPIVAATVLCAWSHPGRIHSEAAFAPPLRRSYVSSSGWGSVLGTAAAPAGGPSKANPVVVRQGYQQPACTLLDDSRLGNMPSRGWRSSCVTNSQPASRAWRSPLQPSRPDGPSAGRPPSTWLVTSPPASAP